MDAIISEELYEFLNEFNGQAFSEALHGIRNPLFLEAAREDLLAIDIQPPHHYELTDKARKAIEFYDWNMDCLAKEGWEKENM